MVDLAAYRQTADAICAEWPRLRPLLKDMAHVTVDVDVDGLCQLLSVAEGELVQAIHHDVPPDKVDAMVASIRDSITLARNRLREVAN